MNTAPVTIPNGADRKHLPNWSTNRLLRYMRSRAAKQSCIIAAACPCYAGCSCGPMFWDIAAEISHDNAVAALQDEIDFIKSILATRENINK